MFSGAVSEELVSDGVHEALSSVTDRPLSELAGQNSPPNLAPQFTVSDHPRHLFLPASGGADLQAVKKANERGCLVLDLDGALHVLQPKSLQFEGFSLDRQACFFRLWNRELRPFQNDELERETLIALENGQYRALEDEYDYDEDPGNRLAEMDDDALHAVLPKMKGEEVDRWHQEVSFVVFSKGSYYNDSAEAYCGLQAGRSRLEFRQLISSKYSEK